MSAMARLRNGPRRQAGRAGDTPDTALPHSAKKAKPKGAATLTPPRKPAATKGRAAEAPRPANPAVRGESRRSMRAAGAAPAPSIATAAAGTHKATLPARLGSSHRSAAKTNGITGLQPAATPRKKRKHSSPGSRPAAEPTSPPEPAPASANFIMSSPKRKPREALNRINAAANQHAQDSTMPILKRRKQAAADDAPLTDSPAPEDAPAALQSPQLRRTAQSRLARSVSEGSGAASPTRDRSRELDAGPAKDVAGRAVNGRSSSQGDSSALPPPSPLKAMLLAPAQILWRRVSGLIPGSLGLQESDSGADKTPPASDAADASSSSNASGSSDPLPPMPPIPGAFAAGSSQSTDWAAADTLTAPPMNPTSLGAGASSAIPACLANGLAGSGMQLYISEPHDFGGVDSCTASPVTLGYPETPSKENIPVYDGADYNSMDIDYPRAGAEAITPLMLARPLADEQQESEHDQRRQRQRQALASGGCESEVNTSQISSLAESEIDAQYDPYTMYDDEEDELSPYLFMTNMPPIPKEHTLRPYALPRKTRSSPPITLVLDLDETLVHCALTKVDNADLVFPVEYNGVNYSVYCRLRPGYREFLEKASELFEVVVFTASQQVYADRLLDLIDPGRRYIRHRLFRDSCVYVNTNYIKDLGILGRDESKLLLVDNCPQAFAYQQSNGIPIESWYEDKSDCELMRLMEFLETLVGVDDVRPQVEARFKTRDKIVEAGRRYRSRVGAAYGSPVFI